MTLRSNVVGQTGTTEPGAGWKQGSAHYSTQQRIFSGISSWDAFYLLTLFIRSNWPAVTLSFGTGRNSHRSGRVCFSTAYHQHSNQIKGHKGAVLTSSTLDSNSGQTLSLLRLPSPHLILMQWENAECCWDSLTAALPKYTGVTNQIKLQHGIQNNSQTS